MRPIICVFGTFAGPNLLREVLVEPNWLPPIHLSESPRLKSTTNQNVDVVGTIVLHMRMGERNVRLTFEIVRNLAVPVRLSTSFIDKFNKRIFPSYK